MSPRAHLYRYLVSQLGSERGCEALVDPNDAHRYALAKRNLGDPDTWAYFRLVTFDTLDELRRHIADHDDGHWTPSSAFDLDDDGRMLFLGELNQTPPADTGAIRMTRRAQVLNNNVEYYQTISRRGGVPARTSHFTGSVERYLLVQENVGDLDVGAHFLLTTFETLHALMACAAASDDLVVRSVVDLDTESFLSDVMTGIEQEIEARRNADEDPSFSEADEFRLEEIERRLLGYLLANAAIQNRAPEAAPFKILPAEQSAIAKFKHQAADDIVFLLGQLNRMVVLHEG